MKAYAIVTEKILEKLNAGVIPWRQRWNTLLPKSFITGREYRGINIFLLSFSGHASRYWITFNQIKKAGGFVRKGEKGSAVVYWHWRTKEEMAKLVASGKAKEPAPCIPFISTVFNLDQVEGVERPEDDVELDTACRIERADGLYQAMSDKPKLSHGVGFRPSYSPKNDEIKMPFVQQFESVDLYYTNLFHELTHATGHASRLGRFGSKEEERFDDGGYSFEELVAEFGAAFLCGISGIENSSSLEDTASYIKGWAKVFRDDKNILLKAASAAQRAVDHVRGVDMSKINGEVPESIAA